MFPHESYTNFIEGELHIVSKEGVEVPFMLNEAQDHFIRSITGRDIILKARQLGFSSLILAIATAKFILGKNERIVCISHETKATQRLLDRVKYFIASYEKKKSLKVKADWKLKMRYNSRNEIFNSDMNNSLFIGTAGDKEFGRGDTITFLHLSEYAFYEKPEEMMGGVLQAVTPKGLVFIETTANGFNYFKDFYERSQKGETGFKCHFYNPAWEYDESFLFKKRQELSEKGDESKYLQEYPSTEIEAFITSGNLYFSKAALKWYLEQVKEPIKSNTIYV
jgi:hypothetical protein